jgi:hypothetical protein
MEAPGEKPAGPTYAAVQNPQPEAVVVYCSDPRFQPAFEQFIARELGLGKGQYIPLVIGGGAGVLAHPEKLPKDFKFVKDRIEFLREHYSSIKRIILINHEDCMYYRQVAEKLLRFLPHLGLSPEHDMAAVQAVFRSVLAHLNLSVELYYAQFADDAKSKVTFRRVGA